MASISKDKNGSRRIQFVAPDGSRPAIRLGKVSQRAAEAVKFRVEQLLAAKLTGHALEADTALWLKNCDPKLADKLARVGLIPSRDRRAAASLGPFIESYIDRRVDVSPHTQRIWRQTMRRLVDHFGANMHLAKVTRGNAADWRLTLVETGMADASVRKHCGFAKHFFAQAVEHELIGSNPFAKLVSSPVGNEARQYFVTRDETQKMLDATPDVQCRLIIALCRYGGLRCPSEHMQLTWSDIDWAENKITVRSPKTAKHPGHESRVVPLFAELRPFLLAAAEAAEKGEVHVVTRYRDKDAALRVQLGRIVDRAGLTPWPKITQNLRASRATELAGEHPAHVAAAWLGHSTMVARKHYWQVTEADFQRAVEGGAATGAQEAQKAAQQAHAPHRHTSHERNPSAGGWSGSAKYCESSRHSAQMSTEVHGNRTHLPCG